MRIRTVILIALCGIILSCNNKQPIVNHIEVKMDSMQYRTYADTIICDMVIKSASKDDKWMNESLKGLQRKALIDTILMDVYTGKLIATDYNSNNILKIDEVKKIEQSIGNNRDIIGKFQFKESWYYDKEKHSFIKKVQSIIFGYEIYDESGYVKGYKPLFRIEF